MLRLPVWTARSSASKAMVEACTPCAPCGRRRGEGLDVTALLFSNRSYTILRGVSAPAILAARALDMLDLGDPDLDRVGLARSMGVPGAKVTNMEAFNDRFAEGIATRPVPRRSCALAGSCALEAQS